MSRAPADTDILRTSREGQKLETKGFNHIHAVSSYHNIMLAHILVDTSAKKYLVDYTFMCFSVRRRLVDDYEDLSPAPALAGPLH